MLTRARLLDFGWLAAVAVSCVSALWAATDTGGKGAAQTGNLPPIVIGVSNVQSGPSSELGHELVLGSQSYFNLVNNSDGGIYGRRISILLKDDKYEPDPAVTNTNELVQYDKVFFLSDYIGTPTLTRTLPLLRYYQSDNIVNVAPLQAPTRSAFRLIISSSSIYLLRIARKPARWCATSTPRVTAS